MARAVTIANLITRAKYAADAESNSHVSDAEWQIYIHKAYGKLHAIVADTGNRFFEAEDTITATGASSYNLPAAYLSTVVVEFVADASGARRPLRRLMATERTALLGTTGEAKFYELTGTTIVLWPKPSSGSYRHVYVPQPTDYSTITTSTEIDTLNVHGEEFITWTAAKMAIQKAEGNVQLAMSMIAEATEGVQDWAANRAQEGNRRAHVEDLYEDWP